MKPTRRSGLVASLVLLLSVPACRTFDESLLRSHSMLESRIPSLEVQVFGEERTYFEDAEAAIYADLARNVVEQEGDPRGRMLVRYEVLGATDNRSWAVLQAFAGLLPALLGVPLRSVTYRVSIDSEILDARDKLVRSYSVRGKGTAYTRLYNGYAGTEANRAAHALATVGALDKLKERISEDVPLINKALAGRR